MEVTYKNQARYKCDHCRKMIPKHKPVKVYAWDETTYHFCGQAHKDTWLTNQFNLRLKMQGVMTDDIPY